MNQSLSMRIVIIVLIFVAGFNASDAQIERDSLNAVRYVLAAEEYVRAFRKDSAMANFEKGAELFHKAGLWEHEARLYNRMSTIHWRTNAFTEALSAARNAERICREHLPPDNREMIEVCNNFGAAYYFSGQFIPALRHYHKAFELQRQVYGEMHSEVANSCNYIGVLNWELGNSVEALKYHQQSLIIRRKVLRENHPYLGYSYNNIGLIYRAKGDYDEALQCFEKALEIAKSNSGEKSLDCAGVLNNIASVLADQGKLELAIKSDLRACKIATDVLGPLNTDVTMGYDNIGSFYERLGRTDDAFHYYNKSLDIRLKLLGPKHSSVARSYYRLAGNYLRSQNYSDAVTHYQKSLIAAIPSFNESDPSHNPRLDDCERQVHLLNVIREKADALVQSAKATGKSEQRLLALQTYLLGDSLVDEVRRGKSNYQDKLDLARATLYLYEGALHTCLELLEETGDARFRERAFYFSERSRAGVLAEALSSAAAKQADVLPHELIAEERRIREDQSRVQTALRSNGNERDSLEAMSFLLDRSYDSLMLHIQQEFPSHYQARYQRTEHSLSDIQGQLAENAILVEFFEGSKNVYVFALTRKKLHLHVISRDSVYDNTITRFRKGLMLTGVSDLNEKNFAGLSESGYSLYQLLLAEALNVNPDASHLIVIPHGQLSFIAFDALLRTKPQPGNQNFPGLDYLIKSFSIQYGYSGALLNQMPKGSAIDGEQLAFAPAYPQMTRDSTRLNLLGKFRGAFTALEWNQREAQLVSRTVGGESVTGSEATEARFKARASSSRLLHLAMHAFVDTEDPMNSKLVFAPEMGTVEDGFLHAFELYNMEINADMVVLSACSTGLGNLAEGEGVLNLARAFSFSGVPSIVMTQWNVDDKASSDLMTLFYTNLKKGMTKSAALREAKLSYLQQADPVHAHPFFWAGFASIGSDSPVITDNSIQRYVLISTVLLVTATAIGWIMKRKTRSARMQA